MKTNPVRSADECWFCARRFKETDYYVDVVLCQGQTKTIRSTVLHRAHVRCMNGNKNLVNLTAIKKYLREFRGRWWSVSGQYVK